MHGNYFTYDNEDSKTYELVIAGLEQNDDVTFGMSREVLKSQLNRYRNRVGHMGTKWSDTLTFNIQFIKSPCDNETNSKMFFTEDEVNDINTWLSSPDYPTLLHMYDYDFERDSSDSMILIDMDEDCSLTVSADGYYTATYAISGTNSTKSVDTTPEYDIDGVEIPKKEPPDITTINKYNGYYSLIFIDKKYLNSIISIAKDDVECQSIQTNTWLSNYDYIEMNPSKENPNENKYTILIDTEKILNHKYDYFGVFSDITAQVIDGNVMGFQATFSTDSPFAWTHRKKYVTEEGSLEINVNSAEKYREIYPMIEIKSNDSDGMRKEFKISNNVDGQTLTIQLRTGDTTTIDSRRSIIKDLSGLVSFTDLGIDDVSYIYWPKLYNGKNIITLEGNGEMTITYREPRKVGDY